MTTLRKFGALVVLAATVISSTGACLSVGIQRVGESDPAVRTGSLRVSVTQHRPKKGATDPPEHPLVSELRRFEGSEEVTIKEVSDSRWTADGLAPGKYAIRVARYIDEQGNTRPLSAAVQKTFSIRAGETVSAEIVVKRFPTGLVVGAGAAVVVGVLVAAFVSTGGPLSGLGSISVKRKRKHKELDTRPLAAPRAAPIPSVLPR